MTPSQRFFEHLQRCPLVAILRGITPDEVEGVCAALIEAGIAIIEVPLNSPDAYESITRLSRSAAGSALVGAGTVLDRADVERVADCGGELIVSPNVDLAVVEATRAAGLVSLPGYYTPTEAFRSVRAGADALKLFPAEPNGLALLRAHRAVLPTDVPVVAVGGVDASTIRALLAAGAAGCGIGSALYAPRIPALEVRRRALACVAAARNDSTACRELRP